MYVCIYIYAYIYRSTQYFQSFPPWHLYVCMYFRAVCNVCIYIQYFQSFPPLLLPEHDHISNTLATHWQHIGNTLASLLLPANETTRRAEGAALARAPCPHVCMHTPPPPPSAGTSPSPPTNPEGTRCTCDALSSRAQVAKKAYDQKKKQKN